MSDIENPSNVSNAGEDVGQTPSHESSDTAFVARRRQLAKLGFGAPVLATLASRPVFAGQCLSNMMSGNLSSPDRGNCSKGGSPVGWGQPGGKIVGFSDAVAYSTAGFSPTALLSILPSALLKESIPAGVTIIGVLNKPYDNTFTRHFVTAYLNAALGEKSATFQYILTRQQVLDLATGVAKIPVNAPGYLTNNFKTFFDSTWV